MTIPPEFVGAFLSFGLVCGSFGAIVSVLLWFLCGRFAAWACRPAVDVEEGHWEAVRDYHTGDWDVRWSVPVEGVFWTRQSFTGEGASFRAFDRADQFNREGRKP